MSLLGELIKAQHIAQQSLFKAREAGRNDVADELREAGVCLADAISLLREQLKAPMENYS